MLAVVVVEVKRAGYKNSRSLLGGWCIVAPCRILFGIGVCLYYHVLLIFNVKGLEQVMGLCKVYADEERGYHEDIGLLLISTCRDGNSPTFGFSTYCLLSLSLSLSLSFSFSKTDFE